MNGHECKLGVARLAPHLGPPSTVHFQPEIPHQQSWTGLSPRSRLRELSAHAVCAELIDVIPRNHRRCVSYLQEHRSDKSHPRSSDLRPIGEPEVLERRVPSSKYLRLLTVKFALRRELSGRRYGPQRPASLMSWSRSLTMSFCLLNPRVCMSFTASRAVSRSAGDAVEMR